MQSIADILKPDVEERMNIQMTPWIESDVVKMEDLYTRLSIERHEKKPHGVEKENIVDENETGMEYKRLLINEMQQTKKILIKGDPGIGKSTLMRKIAWDWAKGIFKSFVVMFVVVLKLVSPMDSIEEMIIQQNPILEGSKVKSKTIQDILEHHGDQCLILLDGYDEMPENIIAIKNLLEKCTYPKCNIVLTSRPNSVTKIEKYFNTVACVEGFSKTKAKEYIEKILIDKSKRDAVMEYSETNEIEDMWRYPVLIMFLCLLVNGAEINIEDDKLSLFELYDRLHNFLYRRYIEKFLETINIDKKAREDIFLKLGKLALEGILAQKHGLKKSVVIKQVGEEVFNYSILIAETDTRKLARDDCPVFFPHKTIQEFLAAKYLVTEVHEGRVKLDTIIGNQKREFAQDNLMFFLFALEYSISLPLGKRKYFSWNQHVSDQLNEYIYTAFNDHRTINLKSIALSGQASDILINQIAKCTNVANLEIEGVRFNDSLTKMMRQMTNLGILRFIDCSYLKTVNEQTNAKAEANKSVRNIAVTNRFRRDGNVDLIEALLSFKYQTLTMLDLSSCNLHGDSLNILSNANESGNLPKLTRLYLNNNPEISGSLFYLFHTVWKCLQTLHATNSNLSGKDIHEVIRGVKKWIPKLRDIKLFINSSTQRDFMTFQKQLPTVYLQYLPSPQRWEFLSLLSEAEKSDLVELDLTDRKLQASDLLSLSEANTAGYIPLLKHLRLSNNILGGDIHEFFHDETPYKCLEMLNCLNCDLQASDLISLSEANAAGYLPVLRHIDLRNNLLHGHLHKMLHTGSKWGSLEILGWREFLESDAEILLHALQQGRLPKLHTVQYEYYHERYEELKGEIKEHIKFHWTVSLKDKKVLLSSKALELDSYMDSYL